jgi:hypothetical protein
VLSDIMGTTGQAIIRAIVAGERDPKVLARYRHGRIRRSADDIARALTGNSGPEVICQVFCKDSILPVEHPAPARGQRTLPHSARLWTAS